MFIIRQIQKHATTKVEEMLNLPQKKLPSDMLGNFSSIFMIA